MARYRSPLAALDMVFSTGAKAAASAVSVARQLRNIRWLAELRPPYSQAAVAVSGGGGRGQVLSR